MTKIDPNILTKEAAERLLANVQKIVDDIPTIHEKIKLLEALDSRFKNLDPAKVIEQMEKLEAGYDRIRKAIQMNRNHGFFVPGVEDEAKRFSLLRCVMAVKRGGTKEAFEQVKAGLEYEILSQFRSRAAGDGAGQMVGIDSQGGFFVPDQVIPDVITAIYTRSVFINLDGEGTTSVSVLDGLAGIPVKIPKFTGGVVAYWIGEQDEYAESAANVGNVTMTPKKLGVLTKITQEMERWGSFGFEQLFRRDMTKALAKKLDWTIAYGTGTQDMPRGIFHNDDVPVYRAETGDVITMEQARDSGSVADWDGGELTFDGLDNMQGNLEDNDVDVDSTFKWISNPQYWRRLRQIKVENYATQSSGQPYLLGAPMLKDSTMRELIGPFDKTTQIPKTNKPGASVSGATDSVTEKYGDVIGGNLGEILLGRWSGVEIEDDEGKGTGFVRDEKRVKMRMHADIGYRHPESLIVCPDARITA